MTEIVAIALEVQRTLENAVCMGSQGLETSDGFTFKLSL